MYGETSGGANNNGYYNPSAPTAAVPVQQVIVLQPNQVQMQTNANTAPAATTSTYPGGGPASGTIPAAQQHGSSLNSGYPGTGSRAQQMNSGDYDPNAMPNGCTRNLLSYAVIAIIMTIIGFILAFGTSSDKTTKCDEYGNNCKTTYELSAAQSIGYFLFICGLIMIMVMLCNAFGCVPCCFCCFGPPIWGPPGGHYRMGWGPYRRGYGGGFHHHHHHGGPPGGMRFRGGHPQAHMHRGGGGFGGHRGGGFRGH